MSTTGENFWTSGAVPLIEPQILEGVIAAASDLALVVSAEGRVLSVIVSAREDGFGNLAHWEGRPVTDFLTEESKGKFVSAHKTAQSGRLAPRGIELNHRDSVVWQFPILYTFHPFGHDNTVLMLGRDLRPIAETQAQLVEAQIALEQSYDSRRAAEARYGALMAQTSEGVLFVNTGTGRIEDANQKAAEIFSTTIVAMPGTAFAGLFTNAGEQDLTSQLVAACLEDETQTVLATAARSGQTVKLMPRLFRFAGQRLLLVRVPAAQAPAQPLGSFRQSSLAEALFNEGRDPIVFVDPRGMIITANDAFVDLVGAPRKSDVTGVGLADFLGRGQIDQNVMLGAGPGPRPRMRQFSTRIVTKLGNRIAVEASISGLQTPSGPVSAIVLRETARPEPVPRAAAVSREATLEDGHRVVELVGSATLKEIVSETTDVIEKLCIETAIHLTGNNRVAAADMLGLSRQSLYVKLRKFDLLRKEE